MNDVVNIPTFQDFYAVYPKKSMKKDAEKRWDELTDDEKKKALNDVLVKKELHAPWLQGNEFIPNPSRYLLREMFNDDLIQKETLTDKQKDNEKGENPIQARFWTMLIQMYGMKFVRAYGEKMPPAWKYSLSGLTQNKAQKILRYLSTDTDEYLPDLPKINRIKKIGDENLFLSLPSPKTTPKEQALNHIKNLKGVFA